MLGHLMPIYTRKGDNGQTSLFNKKRVFKFDIRVDSYGTVDELNSAIGIVLSIENLPLNIKKELIKIQSDLLEIGSALANPQGEALWSLQGRVREFEDFIDEMTNKMPVLKNFILPGGAK